VQDRHAKPLATLLLRPGLLPSVRAPPVMPAVPLRYSSQRLTVYIPNNKQELTAPQAGVEFTFIPSARASSHYRKVAISKGSLHRRNHPLFHGNVSP